MTTELIAHAEEQATFVITASFTDEDGVAVTPNAGLVWHLTDIGGNTINSRQDVSIAVPATSVDIVLSGDDLIIEDASQQQEARILTIEGTYDGLLGSGLPIRDECKFFVDNLVKIPS